MPNPKQIRQQRRSNALREAIFAQRGKAPTKKIYPSYLDGREIEVKVMTVGERRDLLDNTERGEGERDSAEFIALLVIACAIDPETKEPIFTIGDRDTLIDLPSTVVDEIAGPALLINGLLMSSAPDVGAARKNSTATPSASESSDSPSD